MLKDEIYHKISITLPHSKKKREFQEQFMQKYLFIVGDKLHTDKYKYICILPKQMKIAYSI